MKGTHHINKISSAYIIHVYSLMLIHTVEAKIAFSQWYTSYRGKRFDNVDKYFDMTKKYIFNHIIIVSSITFVAKGKFAYFSIMRL